LAIVTSEAHRFGTACITTSHYLATSAGVAVLRDGGNAVDAAVAANLVLGVVAPYACGIGGDCFAIVWDGALHGYNGSGRAPAAATREAVLARHPAMPRHGPLSITVPGAVDAWFALLERFGSRSFAALTGPAIAYARSGFPLTAAGARRIGAGRPIDPGWGEWEEIYGRAAPGVRLMQPGLARTLETVADGGPTAFYRGAIGAAVARHVQRLGGFLDAGDLAVHQGEWVEPLEGRYRDLVVAEMPPNSQGTAALLALHLLDQAGPLPADGPERQHRLIEAVSAALAERDAHLTDPAHMHVAPGLLADPDHAKAVAASRSATAATTHGATEGDTTYLCAVDGDGLCVSLIQSNFTGFGSGVTVPGLGINLHNRGAYFNLDPEHVNVLAPGKRTLHTLMPALARRNGRPWLVFGTMGADGQLQTQVQLLARIVDDGVDPAAALDAPRWLVDPDYSVRAESRFPDAVLDGLRRSGHRLQTLGPYEDPMGHAQVIRIDPDGLTAASDPRCEGLAAGF
jgi:gamma-glutamyltranspeptidase/glutathione hydrolase